MAKKEKSQSQKLGWYKRELRNVWNRSPMKWEAYARAKIRPGVVKCEKCGKEENWKMAEIDHITPVVNVRGFDSIENEAYRLNCPASLLQVLCEKCHQEKSNQENAERRKYAKNKAK